MKMETRFEITHNSEKMTKVTPFMFTPLFRLLIAIRAKGIPIKRQTP